MTVTIRVDDSKVLRFENVMSITTNAETFILNLFYRPNDSKDVIPKDFLCGQWKSVEIEP